MIDFETAQGRFHYRAAGVAIRADHVLLHRWNDADYWVLPGGRVEFGEASVEALRREMREELGQAIEVDRLLWIVESLVDDGGRRMHGIGLYYAMSLGASSATARRLDAFEVWDGPTRLSFAWHPLDRLDSVTVYPPVIRQHLSSLPSHPVHLLDIRTAQAPGGQRESPASPPEAPPDGNADTGSR